MRFECVEYDVDDRATVLDNSYYMICLHPMKRVVMKCRHVFRLLQNDMLFSRSFLPDYTFCAFANEIVASTTHPLKMIIGPYDMGSRYHRISRIPASEYISNCLCPFRNKYSIAPKSFLSNRILFSNSRLKSLSQHVRTRIPQTLN